VATGTVVFTVTDTLGEPTPGPIRFDFTPTSQSAGGATAHATFEGGGDLTCEVNGLNAIGGLGTRYEVRVSTERFKTYAFFQVVVADMTTPGVETPIRLVVDPKRVRGITALPFASLDASLQTFLSSAQMQTGNKEFAAEDKELIGLSGEALYDSLGPLRQASLLNLFTKARHDSAAQCWAKFRRPLVIRQDRLFCEVDPDTLTALQGADPFKSAKQALHKPLAGFQLAGSVKSRDPHANLQVTVMQNAATGVVAADVDIDEASGFEHGFEVIRNQFNGRTNPYLSRELLLLATENLELNPGYGFVFDEVADARAVRSRGRRSRGRRR
jgi:hypothetical protein